MPTPSATSNRPEDVILRLCSPETEVKFKALRELKNQIIGNRTKKLSYVKLGAVPAVVSALSLSADAGDFAGLVQASAVIGSFACGLEAGVRAVLDAGAFSLLFRLISHHCDHKVQSRFEFDCSILTSFGWIFEATMEMELNYDVDFVFIGVAGFNFEN